MPPTSESRTVLGQNSLVSVGLMTALLMAALFYGRQLQRLDSIERQLQAVESEMRELRNVVVRIQPIGR